MTIGGLHERLEAQESLITQYAKTIESVGREHLLRDRNRTDSGVFTKGDLEDIEGIPQSKILDYVLHMQEDSDNTAYEASKVFQGGDLLLQVPFDFYGTSLQLNSEQQIDLANRTHIRYYKMKVNELSLDKEGLTAELEGTRRLFQDLKMQTVITERKI